MTPAESIVRRLTAAMNAVSREISFWDNPLTAADVKILRAAYEVASNLLAKPDLNRVALARQQAQKGQGSTIDKILRNMT